MQKWVLQNEWWIEIYVSKGARRRYKVRVRNVEEKEHEFVQWLTRIVEQWLNREKRF